MYVQPCAEVKTVVCVVPPGKTPQEVRKETFVHQKGIREEGNQEQYGQVTLQKLIIQTSLSCNPA